MGKRYNRLLSILLALVVLLSLSACSSGSALKSDETFLRNMQSALETRWKLSDADDETLYSYTEYAKRLAQYVEAEYEKLGEYTDYQFTDSELEELAKMYFDALSLQREGTKYYGTNEALYSKTFDAGYDTRTVVIYLLCEHFGLSVGEKYVDTLEEMCIIGEQNYEIREALEYIEAHTSIEPNGSHYMVVTLSNTSNLDIETVEIQLKAYDKNDVVVETGSAFIFDVWPASETTKIDVYLKPGKYAKISVQVILRYNLTEYRSNPIWFDT